MNPHVKTLFELARSRVSEQHIADFSPTDPGYESYVRLWTHIHRSGEIPKQSKFDLSEVIGLTGWASLDDFDEPLRFRQYRRFTSAVAVALIEFGNDTESVRVGNYLARDLMIDAEITDRKHFDLVRRVFPIVRDTLVKTNFEYEYPYFTFGSLILAQWAGDYGESASFALKLIEDEAAVRNNESLNWGIEDSRFLLGLTNYDQLNADWIRFASQLSNPHNDENLQKVMDKFAEYAT